MWVYDGTNHYFYEFVAVVGVCYIFGWGMPNYTLEKDQLFISCICSLELNK